MAGELATRGIHWFDRLFENEMWASRGRRDFGEKDFSFRFFERKSADKSAYEIDVTLAVIIE
jgi:hypothetical protein